MSDNVGISRAQVCEEYKEDEEDGKEEEKERKDSQSAYKAQPHA